MNLNPEQKQAIEHTGSPLIIYAGPGTGKTLILQKKYEYLINQNVKAHNILSLTFTRSAAQELASRITQNCKAHPDVISVSTFHAFSLGILKRSSIHAGLNPGFQIIEPGEQDNLIIECLREKGIPFSQNTIIAIKQGIRRIKRKQLTEPDHFLEEYAVNIYPAYQQKLKSKEYIDYDDMIIYALRILKDTTFLPEYQRFIKYILLDEAQDTTIPQAEILYRLNCQNTTIVGDPNQAIYSFAGANPNFMQEFQRNTEASVIHLKTNYRNPQNIINAAEKVIRNNGNYVESPLITDKNINRKIGIFQTIDEDAEIALILNSIENNNLTNVTILYRRNESARIIEHALQQRIIPYRVSNIHFHDRKEIKQIIAVIRFAMNPNDTKLFTEVLKMQSGIGKQTITKLLKEHEISGDPLLKCAQKHLKGFTKEILLTLKHLCETIERLAGMPQKEQIKAIESLVPIPKTEIQRKNITNFKRFLESNEMTLESTLTYVKKSKENPTVQLMTLHAAKGTENDIIFIVGAEEGLIPDENSFINPQAVEEERRLFYVGMTRAKELLVLSTVRNRTIGKHRLSQKPSRFISEIDEKEFL